MTHYLCAVCGAPGDHVVCSEACRRALAERVREIARRRFPRLYEGPPVILDPYVGDEKAIARESLEERVWYGLTRPSRVARAVAEARALGLPDPERIGRDAVVLAEREPGSNTATIEVAGRYFHVSDMGVFREFPAEAWWPDVPWWVLDQVRLRWIEAWEDREFGPVHRVLPSPVLPPRFGDETASALSALEHPTGAPEILTLPVDEEDRRLALEAIARVRAAVAARDARHRERSLRALEGLEAIGYLPFAAFLAEAFQVEEVIDPSGLDTPFGGPNYVEVGVCRLTGGRMVLWRYGSAHAVYADPATRLALYEACWAEAVAALGEGNPDLGLARAGWAALVSSRFYADCLGGAFWTWAAGAKREAFLPVLRRATVYARPRTWAGYDLREARILGEEFGIRVVEHPERHDVFLEGGEHQSDRSG